MLAALPLLLAPYLSAQESAEARTEADYLAVAKEIEETIERFDAGPFQALFEMGKFLERVRGDLEEGSTWREFSSGFEDFDLGASIVEAIEEDGSYVFLGLADREGRTHARFRLITDGALNYHDLLIEPDAAGALRITDAYVYVSGEYLGTGTLHRMWVSTAGFLDQGILKRFVDRKQRKSYLEHFRRLEQVRELLAEGEYRKAFELCDAIPDPWKKEKYVQILLVEAAAELEPELLIRVTDTYAALYPDDVSLPLYLLDSYTVSEAYDKALGAVDELERLVGDDPYLHTLRGTVRQLQGRPEDAKALFLTTLEQEPDLEETYWRYADLAMEERWWDDLVWALERLADECLVEFQDMETVPHYAEFVKTEAYAKWMDRRSSDTEVEREDEER